MGNYKPANYSGGGSSSSYVSMGGIALAVPSTATIKTLYFRTNNATTGKSLFDSSTGAVYTVASGKTFTMVGFTMLQSGANEMVTSCYQGDSQDATTDLKSAVTTPNVKDLYEFGMLSTFAASKYVTFIHDVASGEYIIAYGHEN